MPNPTTADDIISQGANFVTEAAGAPVIVKGIYQRYDQMQQITFKDGAGSLEWDKRQTDLELLGRRYLKLKELRNDYDFVISHYNDHTVGTGVVFRFGSEVLKGVPLSAAAYLSTVESDSTNDGTLGTSAQVTVVALRSELQNVETKLIEIVRAADNCKSGRPYIVPEPYVATIALPEIEGKNMELEIVKKKLVPIGTITMWSGPANAIPEGWHLCDGTSGTPDLRDRFIRGASADHDPRPLTSGEADQHTHFSHVSGTLTTSANGEHSHSLPLLQHANATTVQSGSGFLNLSVMTNTDGRHQHTVAVDFGRIESEPATANKPRWFALCFIMFVGAATRANVLIANSVEPATVQSGPQPSPPRGLGSGPVVAPRSDAS